MKCSASLSRRRFLSSLTFFTPVLAVVIAIGFTTACGSSSGGGQKLSGNTAVTVLLSSTANDQVTRFDVQFQTLALTNQSGKTVTLLSSLQAAEFMHLNGGIEPLMTVSVPQDIYTSATVTFGGQYSSVLGKFRAADSESRIIPLSIKGRR